MGALIGVIVGYAMGTKAGDDGLKELKEAWATIRSSQEARLMVAGGFSMARGLFGKGGDLFAERLMSTGQAHANGSASGATLHPTG